MNRTSVVKIQRDTIFQILLEQNLFQNALASRLRISSGMGKDLFVIEKKDMPR